jgi:hypothetical protein
VKEKKGINFHETLIVEKMIWLNALLAMRIYYLTRRVSRFTIPEFNGAETGRSGVRGW